MAVYKFQLRYTIGLLLVALGKQECAMAATASNVALGKPANQTDEAGGAGASLAVDGDPSTCAETASAEAAWTLDLKEYYVIDEVSIHSETVSQWVTSVGGHSTANAANPNNILGVNDSGWWHGSWIEVAFAKKVRLSSVDIYEFITSYAVGVGEISCYVDDDWTTIWSTTSIHMWKWQRTFSPNLTKSCFSDRIKLTKATGRLYSYMTIDAVRVHELPVKSYRIGMGLTHLRNETESTMNLSTTITATWSPGKGPYRYVKIQANPKTETLKLCEVQIKGYPQPRTPHFRAITGVTMSNPPVSTVFRVFSNSECSTFCLSETEPACVTAQFDKAKHSCALFDGLNHTHDHRNSNVTLVFQFAAHFFEN